MKKVFKYKDSIITIESPKKTVEEIPVILNNLAKEIKDQLKVEKDILDKTLFVYDSFYNTIRECKPVRYQDGYRLLSYIISLEALTAALDNEKIEVDGDLHRLYGVNHYIRISESKEKLLGAVKSDIDNL